MKVLGIVQARSDSQRLPGKVMRPILGKPMIIHVLDRLNKSKYIDKIVLATSQESTDDHLADLILDHSYELFRGNKDNVLDRFKEVEEKFPADVIVRITGDCPLIDPLIVDHLITKFMMEDCDYIRTEVPDHFIRGFDVEVFSKVTLDRVYQSVHPNMKDDKFTYQNYIEHVTLYIYHHLEEFKGMEVKGEPLHSRPYRLCVDTAEDFELVSRIYEHFKDEYISSNEVIRFLDDKPEMTKINLNVYQKTV